MSMNNRKIAGFMSAESIYSLAFYIVMVAAIAGVGAGVMSKTATAKAVSAVSLLRANYQAEISVAGYGAAAPVSRSLAVMSGGLLTPSATPADPASLSGIGTFAIVNRPAAGPTAFVINVAGITSPDACKAISNVGWGTWDAVAKGALTASASMPTTAATSTAAGLLSAKATVHVACNAVTPAAPIALAFVSK